MNRLYIITASVILLLSGAVFIMARTALDSPLENRVHNENTTNTVTVTVLNQTYTVTLSTSTPALDIMRTLSDEGLNFEGKEYRGLGFFITSINGVIPNKEQYWKLLLNGSSSPLGVSELLVSPGDTLTWILSSE